MIQAKIVSSMDKCFLDDTMASHRAVRSVSMLRNQHLSLQLAYTETDVAASHRHLVKVRVLGDLAPYARIRRVENVPVSLPVYPGRHDDNYLRVTPGLYPDVLMPLSYHGSVMVCCGHLRALWLDFEPKGALTAGDYETTVELYENTAEGEVVHASQVVNIHIVGADLPENTLYVTQWFHCDCLAQYYHVESLSERHWEIIENFARTAAENGINLLLTPIFTPALDTYVGGERLTVQLIGITRDGADYTFDFSLLDRWIDMCDRVGIKYFEIAHLFTQWGAAHAPKIMATVDGEYRKLFGWETDATGEEYTTFLQTFLPAFLDHMKARGDDKRCLFHISDEPNATHLEQYSKSKAIVADILKDYIIMDALSNFEFYQQGVVKTPIPSSNHIKPFLDAKVPDLWTYYCCGQDTGVSNRFLAMPGARTRCIGLQFFKYDIAGFLQWGYNFYNNQGSHEEINPYLETCGEYFYEAGDGFSVYPAPDGTAYESMRILQFREGLEDCAAMKLAAETYGKDAVIAEVEKLMGEIRFDRCLRMPGMMLAVRDAINAMIERAL